MKKIVALVLSALLVGCMVTSMQVFASEEELYNEAVTEKEQKISALYDERLDAQIAGDEKRFKEISKELESYGVERLSYEEVCGLLNIPTPRFVIDRGDDLYERFSEDVRINGHTYTYMVIIITPTAPTHVQVHSSSMSQMLTTPKRLTEANLMDLTFSVVGNVWNPAGWVMTLADLIKMMFGEIDTSTIVNNVSATYTWNIVETTANFFMASETVQNMYIPIGMTNKANGWISGTIHTWETDSETGGLIPGGLQYQYTMDYKSPTFLGASIAMRQYVNTGNRYEDRLKEVVLKGVDGETVKKIPLTKPYWEA